MNIVNVKIEISQDEEMPYNKDAHPFTDSSKAYPMMTLLDYRIPIADHSALPKTNTKSRKESKPKLFTRLFGRKILYR